MDEKKIKSPTGLTVDELIKIARTKSDLEDVTLPNQNNHFTISTWLREMCIQTGKIKVQAKDLYAELLEWCDERRVIQKPSRRLTGMFLRQYLMHRRVGGKNFYYINYTTEEVKKIRAKKGKEKSKKEVKALKKPQS
jgi:hypothetical protein